MERDRGADAGVDAVYRRYFPSIREKCKRMLGDSEESRDVAQETFARLWAAQLPLREPNQVVAWIYRTSTRLAIDRLRARRSERGIEDALELPGRSLEN